MCPVCLTTIALVATGAGSAGGLTALVVKKLQGSKRAQIREQEPQSETHAREEKPR